MSGLTLDAICKSYGSAKVLHDISLSIEDGEFVVFVGPSGCGKSTLLKLIAGLEDVTSGRLEIGGRDVTGLEPVDRGIAMVFQSYALYPHLTVFDNIAFPLRLQKRPKDEIKRAVEKAAETLDLTARLTYKPGALSGGQRQRVAIGRAIVRNPQVFLFDEPLSNLDAALRGQMRVELSELHQTLKTTMIYVTHDQVEAMTMADRIVVLRDGVVEQFGTPMQLYRRPRTRFVAGFIGQPGMNFLPARVVGTEGGVTAEIAGGTRISIPVAAEGLASGDTVELGVRPEFLSLAGPERGMEAHVRLIERLGGVSLLHGTLADRTRIIASFDGLDEVPESGSVHLGFDPAQAQLFGPDGLAKPPLAAVGARQ
ncbi:ABC transporter ATP-binding protein [Rhodobacteraceae bacterium CCMM004]|nr:ABC transporter ATP-binding protein [Rhodobacteraceae bacterium CCMM004]